MNLSRGIPAGDSDPENVRLFSEIQRIASLSALEEGMGMTQGRNRVPFWRNGTKGMDGRNVPKGG